MVFDTDPIRPALAGPDSGRPTGSLRQARPSKNHVAQLKWKVELLIQKPSDTEFLYPTFIKRKNTGKT